MTNTDTGAASLDLVRRYYDAFNRGDLEGMLALVADDLVHDVNQGERRLGKAAFHAFCEQMSQSYQERLEDLVIMAAADGRHAAAEFTVHGRYLAAEAGLPPAKGQTYVLPAGAFLAIGDGRITRVTTCYNVKDWLKQVAG